FMDAAINLGVDIVAASELPNALAASNPSGLLTLDFLDPRRAAEQAREFSRLYPIDAIIPVDEETAVVAASAAASLGLKHNPLSAAKAAKNKHLMRETLSRAGVRVPRYVHFTLDDDPSAVAARVTFPCVVKPVFLSTSRGVMRADNEAEFVSALERLEAILRIPAIARRGGAEARDVLAEEFIPGREVALEGLLSDGRLRVLAIFDKPDPLDGPFFEETIYVTPSRLPYLVQEQVEETAASAARAMGLIKGAIHAELRVNGDGAWVIEVAARAIGGLCSRALRFRESVSLEELIIRHALGEDVAGIERERQAAGVMMIPIPCPGVLREVRGLDSARATPGVEEIIISAHITQELLPPPEGASYLGFIFSRADAPDRVEAALREAHGRLEFVIE
ncbi:MAG TPA: ATP-grasp domain-containing protein, partial [Blastocatellia bacterium]|nr:ATP-grasp domain-containing protein [Blastocatellia bacterium]